MILLTYMSDHRKMAAPTRILVFLLVSSLFLNSALGNEIEEIKPQSVTYDGRSLILNGTRQLFFSGSIHYTRAPPEMWADLIQKAKEGGLNAISTYVFWNVHEPVEGQFTFEGDRDLVKFVKVIGEHGLFCILRIGPFIQAEWNHGGFPYWLREIPNITFRTYNEPFMHYMKRYSETVINLMKKENLFAPQGGPIILAQIENEYNMVQRSFREDGPRYVRWAADMAVGLYPDIPWVMCKQQDAPDNVISTCNGRHCGDTFSGPNGPSKPSLWTENWTAQYRAFGDPPSQRAAEDIAYGVARFFSKKGTLNNYYMYYGGTNFGRTSSAFTTTRYYDEAPIDEYGLIREPKWGHLRDLHRALRLSKKALLWGSPTVQRINEGLEITVYEQPGTDVCAAFLNNNRSKLPTTINFRGADYTLPPRSISILPDCKTVVYNTMTIVSQHNARTFHPSQVASNLKWEAYTEKIPSVDQLPKKAREPIELYSLKKDVSDYAWYGTSIHFDRPDLPMRPDILPVLQIANLGHAMIAFVNNEFIGFGHGSHTENKFVFDRPISLKPGLNTIALLCMTVGLPDSGSYLERRYAGVRGVTIQGLNTGTLDITLNQWGHQVGIEGEKIKIFTEEGSKKVQWVPAPENGSPLTWFKTTFDAPEGTNPVALRMECMQKGMVWVNGKSIGRYWSSFRSPIGIPSQSEYHIPRSFLKPKDNLLVIFEETGGKINEVQVQIVNRDTICSYITELHPPSVKSWERTQNQFKPVVEDVKSGAQLTCPEGKVISVVEFASFGDPLGVCGTYSLGTCNSPNSMKVVEQNCLGKNKCAIPLERGVFDEQGKDPCPDVSKTLAVQVRCSHPNLKKL